MKSSKRKISLAVALVISGFGVASAAMAQTVPTLLGGGSTLVQPTIGTEILAFSEASMSYFGVGSGAGQTAFLNNDPTPFVSGSITATGTVDFANSDAPLSSAQIATYQAGRAKTDGPLIQIPYVVTPITIPLVNAPSGTGPALPGSTTPTVALNDADLCGIFSGAITDWSKVTNPDTGSTYAPGAITVVYRSDNSGTTDLLTAHLAAVCPASGLPITFKETQGFASLFPSSTPPSNFKAASGSGGVAQLLKSSTTPAVGYLSPDWTNTFLAPSSASAAANQLAVASLRNTTTNTDVVPTFQQASAAVGTFAAPSGTTVASAAGNPSNWVPNASNPTTGYPISGTSQIIVSQCYASHSTTPSVTTAVVDFLNKHYASNGSILNGNGFATLPASFQTTLVNDFLSGTPRGNTISIGNTTVCGALAGR